MLSDRCLPCLSVTLVYCGQTVGWITMRLGMQVVCGRGHIVLDGNPLPLPQRGTAPNFRFISVVAKWLDGLRCHSVRRYRLRPRRLCVRWGPSSPLQKETERPAQFSAHVHCGQRVGCITMPLGMEVGLSPGEFVLDGDPASCPKRGLSPPQFSAHVYCGRTAARIKMPYTW